MIIMFMVYWMVVDEDGILVPRAKEFNATSMVDSMTFMEELRKIQRADNSIRFVCMSSENPNSVGKPGVDVTDSSYSWTKRRGNKPGLRKV